MKERLETLTHYVVSSIGGFMGGFAIWNFHDLFGNAQTANMISIVCNLVGHNFLQLLLRVIGLAIYFCGFALSVILPRYTKLNVKLVSLGLDAAAIIMLALMPSGLEWIIYLYPIFFAMSFQWAVFSGAKGYVSSTIFSTNNLRQFSVSLTEYACSKDKSKLNKAKFYGATLLVYHLGVGVACVVSMFMGIKGVYFGLIPVVAATTITMVQANIVNVHLRPFRVRFAAQGNK